jgi:hypothetical protein
LHNGCSGADISVMDKITIGAKQMLGSYRVIIREDEAALLELDNDGNPFTVELKFSTDASG